jgi:hypothetical protein
MQGPFSGSVNYVKGTDLDRYKYNAPAIPYQDGLLTLAVTRKFPDEAK